MAGTMKGIPEGASVVIPRLFCRDVAAAIEFYTHTFVYVEDVDATVRRAEASGAQVLIALANQFWGDRTAWIMDPAGHLWTIATRIEETTEQQRRDRLSHLQSPSS